MIDCFVLFAIFVDSTSVYIMLSALEQRNYFWIIEVVETRFAVQAADCSIRQNGHM